MRKIRENWQLHYLPCFFDVPKKVVLVDIAYYRKDNSRNVSWKSLMFSLIINIISSGPLRKLNSCLNWEVEIPIHHVWFTNEAVSSCQESYIRDTIRNVEIRWQEHEDTQKDSKPAKHLKKNPTHSLTRKVLFPASSNWHISQNTEASIIVLKQPSLKERAKSKKWSLFWNGVTANLSFYL